MAVEYGLLIATLAGVVFMHRWALAFAAAGWVSMTVWKLAFGSFAGQSGPGGLLVHLGHEWLMLANLAGLLLGFAVLARHFELSRVPERMPRWLPDGWTGGLALLGAVLVLSSFLDNIAAVMIGGIVARQVYGGRVHLGFLAAMVAAGNAGGAGSVIGDTTTTMLWIGGVSPLQVAPAALGAIASFAVFAPIAARVQHRHQPIAADEAPGLAIDWTRLAIVAVVLAAALVTNVAFDFPAAGVWGAILVAGLVRPIPWDEVKKAMHGALCLTPIVATAGMLSVEKLPAASAATTFALGLLSAVFDNIPLTKLALAQGGYDWGLLAFAIGYGGSLTWFGSSAGVALAEEYPEVQDTRAWLRHGWPVALGYLVGFAVMLAALGWAPPGSQPVRPTEASVAAPAVPAMPGGVLRP
ncbi:MAG: citrate transporter [Deltaproteobacteria bacterium]|nr:citrate transporter [Deltaproteobacteria bacterium]